MGIGDFQVSGKNEKALFTLKVHRGEGMALLAMNWRNGKKPPPDFVGFAIEYKEPGGDRFYTLNNRLTFAWNDLAADRTLRSTKRSPIQKFRWVHFPRNANLVGEFRYRVTPMFMNAARELSEGDPQEVPIALARETYPNRINVTFTRGFVSSQAFVDTYMTHGSTLRELLPAKADDGLTFKPTHPQTDRALKWMGFEARNAILEVLDEAIKDKAAQIRVVAYDLSEPAVVDRLEKLGARLSIVIDNSDKHGLPKSGESQAAKRLKAAGCAVKRQHMGQLQHNKTIVVDGPKVKKVVCGSTNFSWRGFFVQNNNAVILVGPKPVKAFTDAFTGYFGDKKGTGEGLGDSPSASWVPIGINGVDAQVTFSPHSSKTAVLKTIGEDLDPKVATTSVLYSLAFLYQTPGVIQDAIETLTNSPKHLVYGISDKKVGGIEVKKPAALSPAPLKPQELTDESTPEPFKSEPAAADGLRLHHKFIVIDFDQPTARVYLGSHNFSSAADRKNGDHMVLIKDRRIATSYAIEAVRIFDHYEWRLKQVELAEEAKKKAKELGVKTVELRKLTLAAPPAANKPTWFDEYWTDARRKRDRELFA